MKKARQWLGSLFLMLSLMLSFSATVFATKEETEYLRVRPPHYMDKQTLDCELLEESTTLWQSGCYTSSKDLTYSKRITVKGRVFLVLRDDITLTMNKGIYVPKGSSLCIYAQEGQSGKLICKGPAGCAGIGGNEGTDSGHIILAGGSVTAEGGKGAAGIGGGSKGTSGEIEIFYGDITGIGGEGGAGIGGGSFGNCQSVSVWSGNVKAFGAGGAGIGSGSFGNTAYCWLYGGKIEASSKSTSSWSIAGGAGIGTGVQEKGDPQGNLRICLYGAYVSSIGGIGAAGMGSGADGSSDGLLELKFEEPMSLLVCNDGESWETYTGRRMRYMKTWEPGGSETYTVRFDTNGHGIAPASQTVKAGSVAKEPEALTADGFRFCGWYTEKACETKYDFNRAVFKDLTIYAKWEKAEAIKKPTGVTAFVTHNVFIVKWDNSFYTSGKIRFIQLQVATDKSFKNLLVNQKLEGYKSHTCMNIKQKEVKTLYLRLRYLGDGVKSKWSKTVKFRL